MLKLNHNKKRNLGIVYELLTREVSNAVVRDDKQYASVVLEIVSRHFAEGSALHEELSLHRQVMETRGVSERLARRIVDELKAAGIRFGSKRLVREDAKTLLIHDMNKFLGRDVFDRYRIPEYTAHASVNIIMSRALSGRLDEGVELARVEEHLVEFLISEVGSLTKYDPDASLYAYRSAVSLFEKEYGSELNDAQNELLREYVKVSLGGNQAAFERTFERHRKSLHESLKIRRQDDVFKTDEAMAKRLDEAIGDLITLSETINDEAVERLMLFHNLKREIES